MFLAGCWDAIDLEDRGFIAGVAVDSAEEQGAKGTFELTNQFVVPAGLSNESSGGGGKAYRNLSQTGESLYEINADISRQANRTTTTEHLQIVIIAKDLVERSGVFMDLIDVFLRQQAMRRGIVVAIASENAKELFEVEPEHEKVPSKYLSELLENPVNPETVKPLQVGKIQEALLNRNSFTVPQLSVLTNTSANYEGVAVLKGDTSQLVGTLTGEEVKGMNFITGEEIEGSMKAEVDGKMATFSILEGGSTITLKNKDKNNLQFQVDIEVDAQLAEYLGDKDIYKKKHLQEFEKVMEEKIKNIAENTVKKVKDEFQTDVLTFGNHVRMHHYELWQEVKNDWDFGENYFADSDVTIQVNADLREPGNIIQVKKDGEGE